MKLLIVAPRFDRDLLEAVEAIPHAFKSLGYGVGVTVVVDRRVIQRRMKKTMREKETQRKIRDRRGNFTMMLNNAVIIKQEI